MGTKWANIKMILYPACNYMLKVSKVNTRAMCEICSKLTIKTPERRQWREICSKLL